MIFIIQSDFHLLDQKKSNFRKQIRARGMERREVIRWRGTKEKSEGQEVTKGGDEVFS